MFRKGNTCNIATFHRTDLLICNRSREGKTLSYSRINTVNDLQFTIKILKFGTPNTIAIIVLKLV